jgi:hypothetical protein
MRFPMLYALSVACLLQPVAAVEQSPDNSVLWRVAMSLREAQPRWQFVAGICTCPPLMEEQEAIATGGWYRATKCHPRETKGHRSEIANVSVYRIASAEAASRWLDAFVHGGAAKGWAIEGYDLGDQACLATYQHPRRFTITFRKARFLVTVSGSLLTDIDLVARQVLAEVSSKTT